MGNYNYSPDINDKIDAVCKSPAVTICLDHPELNIDDTEDIIKKIAHFLKDNYNSLGTNEYLIEIDFQNDSKKHTLTEILLIKEIQKGNDLIVLSRNLSILSTKKFTDGFSYSGIAKHSQNNKCVVIFIHNGIDITIYSNGVPISQINVNFPDALPVLNKKFNRRAEDYKLSMIDFYKYKVRTNVTDHWHDLPKRILRGGQTEDIFQQALTNWLIDNLSAKKINFKVKKISTDETDIEIVKHGGDTYLIEIKWLGKNEGNTEYDENRVAAAFDQIKNYLDVDKDVLEVTLVVYDGRKAEEFNKFSCIRSEDGNWKEINECKARKMPLKGTGFLFLLISETASIRKAD